MSGVRVVRRRDAAVVLAWETEKQQEEEDG